MDRMTLEKARYVINYFSKLMTEQEGMALRHVQSTFKLEGVERPGLTEVYYRKGWLTGDPEALKLLDLGTDRFIIDSAERILKDSADKVFFNLCPKCGKLARTPQAKQCRFCGFDWH